MRSLLQRHRLGDRMMVVISMVVALAVAALLGFSILIANRVDQDSVEREIEQVRHGLASLAVRMRYDLAAISHWDEAVARTTLKFDPRWIHQHYCVRLRDKSGHDRSFVLDTAGDPIYACNDGIQVHPVIYQEVREAVDPLVRSVRNTYFRESAVRAVAETVSQQEAPPEPVFRGVFRLVDNRPAVVGVITIVPNLSRANMGSIAPAIAISIAFLDTQQLSRLATELSVSGLAVHTGAGAPRDRGAIEIQLGPDEQERAWVVWKANKPGVAMLQRQLPGLIGVAALICLITIIGLIYVRRTTEQLAESERRATDLAHRDSLTGLANRLQLLETLDQRLADLRTDQRVALLLVDLDGFKDINDTLGHSVGDELLTMVGERLESIVSSRGLTVRFGGDEFALLVPIGENNVELEIMCRRIAEGLKLPVPAGEHMLNVGGTIGGAVAPDDAIEPEQLLRRADIALYRAKAEARGAWRMFNPSYEEVLQKRSTMERDLTHALRNDELAVKFQPLYAADGERVVGVEALVRWNHPERGVIPPSEFIPIAEHSGLVTRIDEWVLRRACEHAAGWPGLALAVNLSPTNFRQSNVVQRISRVLGDTGFDPRRLEIEITESMLLGANTDVLGELEELRRMGMHIALDDFGTGYSSLGYLRRFPVDKIKIDKSFVQNLGVTEDAAAIVECVARLGRALGLAVTAEGVETREQHRFVRAAGCHQVQGYLFSPPVDAEKISEMLWPERFARGRELAQRLASA